MCFVWVSISEQYKALAACWFQYFSTLEFLSFSGVISCFHCLKQKQLIPPKDNLNTHNFSIYPRFAPPPAPHKPPKYQSSIRLWGGGGGGGKEAGKGEAWEKIWKHVFFRINKCFCLYFCMLCIFHKFPLRKLYDCDNTTLFPTNLKIHLEYFPWY